MPDEINLNSPQEISTEQSETNNLTKNQLSSDQAECNLASTSGSVSNVVRKDGVTLSAIKSRRNKPQESFTDYLRKKFGITNIEELTSLKRVTRSGKEYGRNPAKELPKKKRSAQTSTETSTPKGEPAKKKLAAVPPSNALKNAKPKKNMVVHDPDHTCSKAQMGKDQ